MFRRYMCNIEEVHAGKTVLRTYRWVNVVALNTIFAAPVFIDP